MQAVERPALGRVLTAGRDCGKGLTAMTDSNAMTTPCPICGRLAAARHAPFCSERCQKLDLAHWLGERYRLPAEESAAVEDTDGDGETS